jgi:hypothetical protein
MRTLGSTHMCMYICMCTGRRKRDVTLSEREPRRVTAEAEARDDPLADEPFVVRKYVRW